MQTWKTWSPVFCGQCFPANWNRRSVDSGICWWWVVVKKQPWGHASASVAFILSYREFDKHSIWVNPQWQINNPQADILEPTEGLGRWRIYCPPPQIQLARSVWRILGGWQRRGKPSHNRGVMCSRYGFGYNLRVIKMGLHLIGSGVLGQISVWGKKTRRLCHRVHYS